MKFELRTKLRRTVAIESAEALRRLAGIPSYREHFLFEDRRPPSLNYGGQFTCIQDEYSLCMLYLSISRGFSSGK